MVTVFVFQGQESKLRAKDLPLWHYLGYCSSLGGCVFTLFGMKANQVTSTTSLYLTISTNSAEMKTSNKAHSLRFSSQWLNIFLVLFLLVFTEYKIIPNNCLQWFHIHYCQSCCEKRHNKKKHYVGKKMSTTTAVIYDRLHLQRRHWGSAGLRVVQCLSFSVQLPVRSDARKIIKHWLALSQCSGEYVCFSSIPGALMIRCGVSQTVAENPVVMLFVLEIQSVNISVWENGLLATF